MRRSLQIAALAFALTSTAAQAAPIEVRFDSFDGAATGQFAFDPAGGLVTDWAPLASGSLSFGTYSFGQDVLRYQYYRIADSVNVRIGANEETGLETGNFMTLSFSNPDGSSLQFPTRGNLAYRLEGHSGSYVGTVSQVPEPLSAGLFTGAAAGVALARRRRRQARPPR